MIYAMADIHGRMDLFDKMLDKIRFSDSDKLYIIGDVIDRGPDGIALLRRIFKSKNMHLIMGNHEHMMFDAMTGDAPERTRWLRVWLENGGEPTYRSFQDLFRLSRRRLLDQIAMSPYYADVMAGGKDYRLVHGSWHPGDAHACMWDAPSPYIPGPDPNGRVLIIGHTPSFLFRPDPAAYLGRCSGHMEIFRCDYFTAIDCGAGLPGHYSKRALACLRLDDGVEFYVDL